MDFLTLKNKLDDMTGKYYQGIDICVHHKGEEVLRYQAGYSDLDSKAPVNPDAMYHIYSCSKPATCVAAMQLFEKGEFLLNDPLKEYLPEFSDMYVRDADGNIVKAKSDITIKQLFTMTAGLDYNLASPSIKKVMEEKGDEGTTEDFVKAISNEPLSFHPGENWQYSLCHDVLGRLIEVISGMTFGEYMKENIFDRCGMKRTCFNPSDEIKKHIPIPYYTGNGRLEKGDWGCEYQLGDNSKYESGGAGIVSCVEDYIKFVSAMSTGGVSKETGERILSQGAIDLMRTNMLNDQQLKNCMKTNEGYGYGLGVRTYMGGVNSSLLTGVGEFGWDGAAGSYVMINPEKELAVFAARYVRHPFNYEVNSRITNVLGTMF